MRLLLIEDSSCLRDLLTERVHGAGWRLDSVASASEARSAAAAIPYDLILLDLGLPDYDGKVEWVLPCVGATGLDEIDFLFFPTFMRSSLQLPFHRQWPAVQQDLAWQLRHR
jgi:hypothetical protein